MSTRSRRLTLAAIFALALALGAPLAAEAKKAKTFSEQVAVDAAIPPDPPTGASSPLVSEIKVPKKFKKKVVGDVNVTGIQTSGSAAGAADDLLAWLSAPNGRTIWLIVAIGDISIGPLTLDDDSPTVLCNDAPAAPCFPGGSLIPPFAGTANLVAAFGGTLAAGPLSQFDGVKMRGTWTLSIADNASATNSTLNQWGLRIKPAKPVSE